MSKKFVQWIKSAVTNLIDPEREERVKSLVAKLTQGLKQEQKAFRLGRFKAQFEFREQELNDAIRVVEGPFSDFTGKIEEVNTEKEKLKVLINIFGRDTPVELDFTQVEKL